MHAMRYEPNEVTVDGEGSVENYGEYAEGLLAVCHTWFPVRPRVILNPRQDDAMLFITVRSASPADVPKVLQVVEHVKRLRHKRGELTMSIPSVSRFTPFLPLASHPWLFLQRSTRGSYPRNCTNTW
jgi:hypothetical protein